MSDREQSNKPPRLWLPPMLFALKGMFFGRGGHFLCPDCRNDEGCRGCPVSYRDMGNGPEYYRHVIHGGKTA